MKPYHDVLLMFYISIIGLSRAKDGTGANWHTDGAFEMVMVAWHGTKNRQILLPLHCILYGSLDLLEGRKVGKIIPQLLVDKFSIFTYSLWAMRDYSSPHNIKKSFVILYPVRCDISRHD
jgi:hypothetical protein